MRTCSKTLIRTGYRMDIVGDRIQITRFQTSNRSLSNLKPREVYRIGGVNVNGSLEGEPSSSNYADRGRMDSSSMSLQSPFEKGPESLAWNRDAVLRDYRVGIRSRHCSVLGRKEVFSGKAKFGIFGAGKEVAQMAMAYAFKHGDFRSGYYRDQTFMFALDLLTPEQFLPSSTVTRISRPSPLSGADPCQVTLPPDFWTRPETLYPNWIDITRPPTCRPLVHRCPDLLDLPMPPRCIEKWTA